MLKYLLLATSLVFTLIVDAQQVTIIGNAKSYTGDTLVWKTYNEQITSSEKILAKCKVAENGNFEFNFSINETIPTFINLNVFKGFLTIEPNKQYEIVLPKKTHKLPEDKLNPFFKESEFYVRVLNTKENELNRQLIGFDKLYNTYTAKYAKKFNGKIPKSIADSIVNKIEKEFKDINNSKYFKNYKKYSYAALRLNAFQQNKEKIIEEYFYNQPILYNNAAYVSLFNKLFYNYLAKLYQTPKGKIIPYFLVKFRSLSKIKSAMDSIKYLENDTLQEMIICKSLYDNFYKEDFPKKSIIAVLDSVRQFGVNEQNRKIADEVYKKITRMLIGYPAPYFNLPDKRNKNYSLSRFKHKFVYLNFVNPNSYTCMQDLELLKDMYAKKYDKLKIVSICICDNIFEMKKLIENKGYKWTFLFYANNQEFLSNYKVKVYPTYYLINPEGKLSMSPAFPPSDNSFEERYFNVLKLWEKEIKRKKSQLRVGN